MNKTVFIATVSLLACVQLFLIDITNANTSNAKEICMAPPSAQIANVDSTQAVNAVRELVASYLTGPSLSIVHLNSRLQSQARIEAMKNGCAYVLFTTVQHQTRTVSSGLMQQLAAGAVAQGASQAAYEAKSTTGRIAASAAAGGAGNTYIYTTTKTKDQITLQYRLENASGVALAEETQSRKANSDGEDLLTPLVETAAEAIASEVLK